MVAVVALSAGATTAIKKTDHCARLPFAKFVINEY